MTFTHLHVHSHYSVLDGMSKVPDLVDKSIKLGMPAIALTDHGCMYGVIAFYNECKKNGIKPIIGCEVYVASGSRFERGLNKDASKYNHLVLLCKNEIGYKNLMYMVSKGYTEGFYSRPRVDMELLRDHSDGLIALSACIAGRVPSLLLKGEYSELKLRRALTNSRMLSCDVSAGFDPLYASAFEKKNAAILGRGVCYNKFTGSRGKSGSNDANAEFIGALRRCMRDGDVSYQFSEMGKVDLGGGGTIAYMLANYGMSVIDCGIPVLSMHAPWEVTSKADIHQARKGYEAFLLDD